MNRRSGCPATAAVLVLLSALPLAAPGRSCAADPAGDPAPGATGDPRHEAGRGPRERPARTVLPEEGARVPMLRSGGHLPVVEVRVNGRGPYRFAIDTGGAGLARIDSSLAARLDLPVVGSVTAGDPSGLNRIELPVVQVDSIEVGGARFVGLTAAARNFAAGPSAGDPVDGVLGFGLFADALLTLDYPGGRVLLERGALPPADGRDVLAYSDEDGIPSVTLRVDTLSVRAHLDAGSPGGFTLPDSLEPRLALAEEPRVVGRGRTVNNTFEIRAARIQGEVRLGGAAYPNAVVEFVSIFPFANVGARVLRDCRVTFDQRNHRVRLTRTGK
jgi:hypothetical protein